MIWRFYHYSRLRLCSNSIKQWYSTTIVCYVIGDTLCVYVWTRLRDSYVFNAELNGISISWDVLLTAIHDFGFISVVLISFGSSLAPSFTTIDDYLYGKVLLSKHFRLHFFAIRFTFTFSSNACYTINSHAVGDCVFENLLYSHNAHIFGIFAGWAF